MDGTILGLAVVMAIIGAIIGSAKGRTGLGFALGLFLGFIGWIVILVIPAAGPKCPFCGGATVEGAIKCRHCGSTVLGAPRMGK